VKTKLYFQFVCGVLLLQAFDAYAGRPICAEPYIIPQCIEAGSGVGALYPGASCPPPPSSDPSPYVPPSNQIFAVCIEPVDTIDPFLECEPDPQNSDRFICNAWPKLDPARLQAGQPDFIYGWSASGQVVPVSYTSPIPDVATYECPYSALPSTSIISVTVSISHAFETEVTHTETTYDEVNCPARLPPLAWAK
jgi:hypothetical protein